MYYKLDTKVRPRDPDLANTKTTHSISVPWTMGIKYTKQVPCPIVVELNPKRGRKMRDLFLIDVPLFSQALLNVLDSCGVDNLQLFDAEIHSSDGNIFKNYKAVNIVGLVSCADLSKSIYLPESEPPLIEFSKLVIDEGRAKDKPLFRLAEDSLYILVSEKVKEEIEKAKLVGFGMHAVESS